MVCKVLESEKGFKSGPAPAKNKTNFATMLRTLLLLAMAYGVRLADQVPCLGCDSFSTEAVGLHRSWARQAASAVD
jgi:hypothetical protein